MLGSETSRTLGYARSEALIPAAITDVGCEREINEDRYALIDSPAGRAWIVCDGMGGVMGGELAAQLAIDAIRRRLETSHFDSPEEALRDAIDEANRIIVLRRQNPAFSSMGTTIVAMMVQDDEVILAHAGDSRAYLLRGDSIQQLTIDHTYVQDLVDRGVIKEEDALSHPQAHVLTRCVGAEPGLKLALQRFWLWKVKDVEPQDKLVLCSDGLYSLVSDEEIVEIINRFSPQESCARLVELAKLRGGYDNITLAILPLSGQLREERPAKSGAGRRKKTRTMVVQTPVLPPMPLGKRIALMTLLFLLGSVGLLCVAVLAFMLS